MDSKDLNLTSAPIKNLVKMMAIPAIIGFFFNTLFNIVDTIYSGLISTQAIAALSLSFPIFFILISIGTGLSTGATAIISNHLGKEDHKEGKIYALQTISFGILISIPLTFIGLVSSPYLFKLLGATGEYLFLSLAFMNTIFYGTIFFIMVYVFNSILNAIGDTKTFRNFLVVGLFVNIVLDPMFMFGWLGLPEMGVAGVALATVLVQAGGMIYMGWKASKTFLFEQPSFEKLIPQKGPYLGIIQQGVPSALNTASVGVGIFIITYFISIFGKEAVAAYGIATRVEQLFLLPLVGLSVATLTLVGQNNGARKFDRVRETLKITTKYGVYIMTFGALCIFFFSSYFMRIFTSDINVISIGSHYLKYAAFLTWAYLLLFLNVSALQGLKKPMYALYVGLARQIILPVFMFKFLSLYFGINGIWASVFFINWLAAIVTIFYAKKQVAKLQQGTTS
jgi:putative MATE family efflux protein